LEIWGVDHVLTGPGMPGFLRQFPVVLPHAHIRLDAAIPELRVAIELDGAAFHGDQAARERDMRRDVALAGLGWVDLRFSYRRLTTEPDACRREILEVCAARRSLPAARWCVDPAHGRRQSAPTTQSPALRHEQDGLDDVAGLGVVGGPVDLVQGVVGDQPVEREQAPAVQVEQPRDRLRGGAVAL
jgi:very-short-patch-repair endonuclease